MACSGSLMKFQFLALLGTWQISYQKAFANTAGFQWWHLAQLVRIRWVRSVQGQGSTHFICFCGINELIHLHLWVVPVTNVVFLFITVFYGTIPYSKGWKAFKIHILYSNRNMSVNILANLYILNVNDFTTENAFQTSIIPIDKLFISPMITYFQHMLKLLSKATSWLEMMIAQGF